MTGEWGRLARSRNRSTNVNRAGRDAFDIANPTGLLGLEAPDPVRSSSLLQLEDRRTFSPVTYRPPATVRRPFRLVVPNAKPRFRARRASKFEAGIAFDRPEAVLVCVRRHRRREVLFAKSKAGRGGMRRPRRTWLSSISCRRR